MIDLNQFHTKLLTWYRDEARDLPWRRTTDPYAIWLSEIMLQQTRVSTVIPYYHRFLETLPDVASLAAVDEELLLKLWEGLGYYRRVRNFRKAAQRVVNDMDGIIPDSSRELQKLPGIGRYTAAAIASIAYGECSPVLDGNVKRVLSRLYTISAPINETRSEKEYWDKAEALMVQSQPGDYNQAMMELGARICIPRSPNCAACPVKDHCKAFSKGKQNHFPVKTGKKEIPVRTAVSVVFETDGHVLIGKRPSNGMLSGLWEFPTKFYEASENDTLEAATSSILTSWGISRDASQFVVNIKHTYSHFTLHLHVVRCSVDSLETVSINSGSYDKLEKIPLDHLEKYAFHTAQKKIFSHLQSRQESFDF